MKMTAPSAATTASGERRVHWKKKTKAQKDGGRGGGRRGDEQILGRERPFENQEWTSMIDETENDEFRGKGSVTRLVTRRISGQGQ